MTIENELDAYIQGFHLNALSSGLPLNVDLDTTLTVIAGNLYRLLARQLPRYENATPDRLWRHFLNATGTLHTTQHTITVDLRLRTYHPVLIDAGLANSPTKPPKSPGSTIANSASASRPGETSPQLSDRESRLTSWPGVGP